MTSRDSRRRSQRIASQSIQKPWADGVFRLARTLLTVLAELSAYIFFPDDYAAVKRRRGPQGAIAEAVFERGWYLCKVQSVSLDGQCSMRVLWAGTTSTEAQHYNITDPSHIKLLASGVDSSASSYIRPAERKTEYVMSNPEFVKHFEFVLLQLAQRHCCDPKDQLVIDQFNALRAVSRVYYQLCKGVRVKWFFPPQFEYLQDPYNPCTGPQNISEVYKFDASMNYLRDAFMLPNCISVHQRPPELVENLTQGTSLITALKLFTQMRVTLRKISRAFNGGHTDPTNLNNFAPDDQIGTQAHSNVVFWFKFAIMMWLNVCNNWNMQSLQIVQFMRNTCRHKSMYSFVDWGDIQWNDALPLPCNWDPRTKQQREYCELRVPVSVPRSLKSLVRLATLSKLVLSDTYVVFPREYSQEPIDVDSWKTLDVSLEWWENKEKGATLDDSL